MSLKQRLTIVPLSFNQSIAVWMLILAICGLIVQVIALSQKVETVVHVEPKINNVVEVVTKVEKKIANLYEILEQQEALKENETFDDKDLNNTVKVFDLESIPESKNTNYFLIELTNIPFSKSLMITGGPGGVLTFGPSTFTLKNNIVMMRFSGPQFFLKNKDDFITVSYMPDIHNQGPLYAVKDTTFEITDRGLEFKFKRKEKVEVK